jgi:hypothetical protein
MYITKHSAVAKPLRHLGSRCPLFYCPEQVTVVTNVHAVSMLKAINYWLQLQAGSRMP